MQSNNLSATTVVDPEIQSVAQLPITVIIPIKNEEANLFGCLQTLVDFTEVIVVDSQSTDRSIAIAKEWGAKVLQFKWNGHFPKKRNWTLETYAFRTPWVLFLDADERVTPEFIRELRTVIWSSPHVGYWISYANHFQGRRLRFGVPQRKLALFRANAGRYERIDEISWSNLDMEIHEHPLLNGSVGRINARVEHYDYKTLRDFIERHNSYSSWEASRYVATILNRVPGPKLTFRQKVKYRLICFGVLPPAYFIYTYILMGGILDGWAGLHYAIRKAIYFFDVACKVSELNPRGPLSLGPR